MSQEPIDTNCMTLTRWILAEQKKYAPDSTGEVDRELDVQRAKERYTKS